MCTRHLINLNLHTSIQTILCYHLNYNSKFFKYKKLVVLNRRQPLFVTFEHLPSHKIWQENILKIYTRKYLHQASSAGHEGALLVVRWHHTLKTGDAHARR